MDTKHTPGPLVVLPGGDGLGWDVETRERSDVTPALIARFEHKEDADLFAAAPKLLAACEDSRQNLVDLLAAIADQGLEHGAAAVEGRAYSTPARALAAARRANGGEWPTYVVVRPIAAATAAGDIQLSDAPRRC